MTMTIKQWGEFFSLMRNVIHLPGTADEKRDQVIEKAKEFDEEITLDEFASMFGGDGTEEVM